MDTTTITTVAQGITVLASITAILAIVNLVKKVFPTMPSRWWPLIAVLLGIVFSVCDYLFIAVPLYLAIVGGLKLGLTACGLWDVTPDTSSGKIASNPETDVEGQVVPVTPATTTDADNTAADAG